LLDLLDNNLPSDIVASLEFEFGNWQASGRSFCHFVPEKRHSCDGTRQLDKTAKLIASPSCGIPLKLSTRGCGLFQAERFGKSAVPRNLAPKLPTTYIHNLTSILADHPPIADPGELDYSIPKQPFTVHDLPPLEKRRCFQLVTWGEQVSGTNNITVDLGASEAEWTKLKELSSRRNAL
jgi:hypothetical protein